MFEDRKRELSCEKAELEKAIHVIYESPSEINSQQRVAIDGIKAHLKGIDEELRILGGET